MMKHGKLSSGSKASTQNPCETTSSGEPEVRHRFPAARRIKSREDFSRIFARGKVASDATLVLHAIWTDADCTKLGLSISKKVGNAPQRNRWKRLIREAFRTHQARIPAGMLMVVRPRRGAQPDYGAIRSSLLKLSSRLERQLNRSPS